MAFNKIPTSLFPSYTFSSSTLHIPLASVTNLNSGLADAATGDSREICEKMLATMFAWYQTLVAAGTKPAEMTVNKSQSVNTQTGAVTNSYSVQFIGTSGTFFVSSEP